MRSVAIALAVLAFPALASADVSFRFPGSDAHRQYYYITAYRDLTGPGNGLKDWGCGTKTYDGHRGTDMGVGSFPGMDAGRDVVAAAAGIVTYVVDGHFDRCTTGNCAGGGGFGNYVRVEHADGKVTYYGHLKKFSIVVANGDAVTCGQKLGQVGSSGNSTGPHLHFEPRINNVSDDPYSGPCGGPISWWVDQGPHLGLPDTVCQDAPTAHPLLTMGADLEPIEGQEPDAYPDGDSAGIFDLLVGQTVTTSFLVTADGSAAKSPNVVVGLEAAGEFLSVVDWQVLDNYAGNACGGDWCPNDANDNPVNPPHQRPGESLEIHLNALSPGETKKLVVTLEATAATMGQPPHAQVRTWVKEVAGSYEKPSFDAPPNNIDGSQTFNDGNLALEVVLDTWPAPGGGGGQPPDGVDPAYPQGDDPAAGGGCTVTAGATGGFLAILFAALLVAAPRRRRL
jgi:murein DD-endopeptidase MepM/ murein hydrolase activator NlpD